MANQLKTVEDVKNFYNNLDEQQKNNVWYGVGKTMHENACMKLGIGIGALVGVGVIVGKKIKKHIKQKKFEKDNEVIDA